MEASVSDRFSSKLSTVGEAPEPFRHPMIQHLAPNEVIRFLVFGPAWRSLRKHFPASLVVVTDRGWAIILGDERKALRVVRAEFTDIILVELTSVLLVGRLKIEFKSAVSQESISVEFNTVTERLYQEVIQLLLEGIHGTRLDGLAAQMTNESLLKKLPLKFRNALIEYQPANQRVRSVVHWMEVYGGKWRWFQRELSPQAMLVLTDNDLMLVSEEKASAWLPTRGAIKHGKIITYCPLSRLEGFRLSRDDHVGVLDFDLRVNNERESFGVTFPRERERRVEMFMKRAMDQRSKDS